MCAGTAIDIFVAVQHEREVEMQEFFVPGVCVAARDMEPAPAPKHHSTAVALTIVDEGRRGDELEMATISPAFAFEDEVAVGQRAGDTFSEQESVPLVMTVSSGKSETASNLTGDVTEVAAGEEVPTA